MELIFNTVKLWIIFFLILLFLFIFLEHRKKTKLKRKLYSGNFLYYKDFEANWIVSDSRGKTEKPTGFKYEDGPGCYVITIYNRPVKHKKWEKYENIYIGQSLHVCQRVHNHFNGKGNGDIYADIKYGKYVYVRFIKCEKEEMNDLEKELIATFNATSSYNKTKGGATKW